MRSLGAVVAAICVVPVACGGPAAPAAPGPSAPPPEAPVGLLASASATVAPSAEAASATALAAPAEPKNPCPAGMIYVDGTYCPEVERTCLYEEKDNTNHIRICHSFAHETRCKGKPEPRRFCIDKYEFPNAKGAHPPWLVSWYDGEAACGAEGKRLCYESEWVTACEGPEHTPFPYGWDRDPSACNIDNTYLGPDVDRMYASDRAVADAELGRLDQSVASGALPGCVSGYGVRDLTGNFDEWVTRDAPAEAKSKWAGLKGGAWGHVRNACRPVTTSHPPQFTYYFISFRCCADVPGTPPYAPTRGDAKPTVAPKKLPRLPSPQGAPGPSPRKVPRGKRSKP